GGAFDLIAGKCRYSPLRVADQQLFTLATQRSRERATIGQQDVMRHVIGIDRITRFHHVAEHRGIVAMQQIREVGTDRLAFAANAMATRTERRFAEEEFAATRPIASRQFWNRTLLQLRLSQTAGR